MREIKFRAYTGTGWLYFTLEQLIDGCATSFEAYNLTNWSEYTGLHDKNGKEIYEGDIITYGFKTKDFNDLVLHTGKIFFDEYMFLVDGDKVNDEWHSINRIHYTEVIGNIYENKELLT